MSYHQQRHHAALLRHQHVEGAARSARIHRLEPDAGTQEPGPKGCMRKDLALPGSQQHKFGIECEDGRGVESGQILHAVNVGRRAHRGGADDDGYAVDIVIDSQLAVAVRANQIGRETGVLSEAHLLKILKMAPQRSSTRYLRFTAPCEGSPQRCPLLEQMLARSDACAPVTDWRADAFRVIASPGTLMPGVAAAALYADLGAVRGESAFIATAVHYVAEMNNVRLAADGVLSLNPSEVLALAGDFNRVWHDAGIRMLAGRSGALYCVTDRSAPAITQDPQRIKGGYIEPHLPAGAAAAPLRQLMSEIEMWLFEHPVNRVRIAAGRPAVSALWLWGCGAVLSSLPTVEGWAAGDDPFFNAFAERPDAARVAGAGGEVRPGPGVVVIGATPGTAEWAGIGSHWLKRCAADLRSGRIGRLELSAADRKFIVSARWRRRLWRRTRPWWECFA